MNQTGLFIPAQVGRASEDVALQIEAAIMAQKIQPGERLPSERKLQEQFQTGRGVIREAIRALKQKGLIEIKKGAKGGAYIKQIDVSSGSESLALFLTQNQIDPDHVSEFRESVDRTITLLAVSRASESEKEHLLEDAIRLKGMALEDDPDMEQLAELDRSMNLNLAKMAKNPVFDWIMNAVQLGFSSNDFVLYQNPYFRKKTVQNWLETATLIKANDPLQALASISRHYRILRRCLKKEPVEDRMPSDTFWDETENSGE
jgi:DNA-binding FadR family transcriptional regulator